MRVLEISDDKLEQFVTINFKPFLNANNIPWKNLLCNVDGGHPVANDAALMLYFSSFTSRIASLIADSGYSFLLIGPVISLGRRMFCKIRDTQVRSVYADSHPFKDKIICTYTINFRTMKFLICREISAGV